MLDLDNPHSQFIFEASGLLDALLYAEQEMVRVSPAERETIFLKCREWILKLHRLNDEQFQASEKNYEALGELETALASLCAQDTEQFSDETDPCARCGKRLERFEDAFFQVAYCPRCSKVTQEARHKLEWGFRTMFI